MWHLSECLHPLCTGTDRLTNASQQALRLLCPPTPASVQAPGADGNPPVAYLHRQAPREGPKTADSSPGQTFSVQTSDPRRIWGGALPESWDPLQGAPVCASVSPPESLLVLAVRGSEGRRESQLHTPPSTCGPGQWTQAGKAGGRASPHQLPGSPGGRCKGRQAPQAARQRVASLKLGTAAGRGFRARPAPPGLEHSRQMGGAGRQCQGGAWLGLHMPAREPLGTLRHTHTHIHTHTPCVPACVNPVAHRPTCVRCTHTGLHSLVGCMLTTRPRRWPPGLCSALGSCVSPVSVV